MIVNLPEIFTNYYTVLGSERIRALGYNITDMKREYEGVIGNQNIDIKSIILSSFNVGGRYTKTSIKEKLSSIYSSSGYSKTPKATDLENYFEVSVCRIPNKETGKRDAGYEIIKIKEV